jgi:hypothetical protein
MEEIWKCGFGSQCSKVSRIGVECCPCACLTVTPKVASTLLYLETCLVDHLGRVEGRRINKDDLDIIEKLIKEKFIDFGRLKFDIIESHRGSSFIPTHWVRFSSNAWILTHKLRYERSERMIEKEKEKLLVEMTKNI